MINRARTTLSSHVSHLRARLDPSIYTAHLVAGLDDAVLVGEHDGLHPVAEAEFEQDSADVALDGRLGDDQPRGDLAVLESAGHQHEHLTLARR